MSGVESSRSSNPCVGVALVGSGAYDVRHVGAGQEVSTGCVDKDLNDLVELSSWVVSYGSNEVVKDHLGAICLEELDRVELAIIERVFNNLAESALRRSLF